jgi:hypothetical protein
VRGEFGDLPYKRHALDHESRVAIAPADHDPGKLSDSKTREPATGMNLGGSERCELERASTATAGP